jgi:hypothetical protein
MAKAPQNKTTLPRRTLGKARAQLPGSEYERGSELPNARRNLIHESVRALRDTGQTSKAIRKLAKGEGAMSFSVFAYVQVAMSGYRVKAYDSATHQYSAEGTRLARSVLATLDVLYDYSQGFNDKNTMDQVVETSLREVVETGGLASELVLNRQRLPDRVNVVAYDDLRWKSRGKGSNEKYPIQRPASGEEVALDIPTFFIAESHLDADQAYPTSMMEAALNMVFYHEEFIEDVRRVVRKSGHSRLVVTLDAQRVRDDAPAEVRQDSGKLKTYMEGVRTEIEGVLSGLEPEDAIVTYDSANVEGIAAKGEKTDYSELMSTISGQAAVALKSHPSILGMRMAGSQSLSNTESLIFLKIAKAIQQPVEGVFSRLLTLACRLYGADIYVRFRFEPINLRPESELEAFHTMREDRILRRLSLGLIDDEQAAEELGIGELPPGYQALSGTRFWDKALDDQGKQPSPNQDPQGRATQPPTPKRAGGKSQ